MRSRSVSYTHLDVYKRQDVEGTFAGLCSDVFHDGEVYFELHDVFHLLGSLAAFVCGLHRDVGGVQLGGKCHGLGKVLLDVYKRQA